jgi:hypothetical protein
LEPSLSYAPAAFVQGLTAPPDAALRWPGATSRSAGNGAKGQAGRLACFNEFAEEAKVSGLVQRAIERAEWRDAQYAALQTPELMVKEIEGFLGEVGA